MFRSLRCTIALLCLFISNVNAQQWVHIPDTSLRNDLVNGYSLGGCFNATQDSIDANCPAVLAITEMYLNHATNLEGMQAFSNLVSLQSGSMVDNVGTLPSGLTTLYLQNLTTTSLPTLPNGLRTLGVGYTTSFTTIGSLPDSLRALYLSDNSYLVNLPAVWPDSLQTLYLDYNASLLTLNNFPPHLKRLWLIGEMITSVTNLPTSLKYLDCTWTYFTTLPDISNTEVDTLNLVHNHI
jgi:hypothetical protein